MLTSQARPRKEVKVLLNKGQHGIIYLDNFLTVWKWNLTGEQVLWTEKLIELNYFTLYLVEVFWQLVENDKKIKLYLSGSWLLGRHISSH